MKITRGVDTMDMSRPPARIGYLKLREDYFGRCLLIFGGLFRVAGLPTEETG
jgi:hypothetical protein